MATTTTATTTMATATGRARPGGFGPLPCPQCGQDAAIRLDLDTLADFTCPDCDAGFSAGDVTAFIDRWTRVLAKVEALRDSL